MLDRGVQDLDVQVQVEGGSRFLGKKISPRAYRADNEVEVDHGTDEGGRPRETTSPRPGFPDGPGIQSNTACMFEWVPVATRLVFLLTNTRTFQLLEASGSLK